MALEDLHHQQQLAARRLLEALQQVLLVDGDRRVIDLHEMIAEAAEIDRGHDVLIGLDEVEDVGVLEIELHGRGGLAFRSAVIRTQRITVCKGCPALG